MDEQEGQAGNLSTRRTSSGSRATGWALRRSSFPSGRLRGPGPLSAMRPATCQRPPTLSGARTLPHCTTCSRPRRPHPSGATHRSAWCRRSRAGGRPADLASQALARLAASGDCRGDGAFWWPGSPRSRSSRSWEHAGLRRLIPPGSTRSGCTPPRGRASPRRHTSTPAPPPQQRTRRHRPGGGITRLFATLRRFATTPARTRAAVTPPTLDTTTSSRCARLSRQRQPSPKPPHRRRGPSATPTLPPLLRRCRAHRPSPPRVLSLPPLPRVRPGSAG
jgi:hypothetical protein